MSWCLAQTINSAREFGSSFRRELFPSGREQVLDERFIRPVGVFYNQIDRFGPFGFGPFPLTYIN